MVDIIKQDMADIWASSGDKTAPNSAKIATGWVVEAVPRQWWNWFENRQDTNIAYMLQKGIPEWDAFTEYQTNKSYVQRNNVVYKAKLTGINQDPATATTYWGKAFPESSASLEALRALTPATDRAPYFTNGTTAALMTVTAFARTILDDTTNTAVRTTIGAQASHANLTALSGATAATNTFPYWNSATTMLASPITAFGRSLIDDADASAARTTLGLGTTATLDVTTSALDTTAGRVLKVGDWGLGSGIGVADLQTNLDTLTRGGFYAYAANSTGAPNTGSGSVIHLPRDSRPTQIATDYVTKKIFIRYAIGLGFSTWSELSTTDAVLAKMGEFGLGNPQPAYIANIDDATLRNGWYATQAATSGTMPDANRYGVLVVNSRSSSQTTTGRVVQKWFGTDNANSPSE